jgi:hypothetical protein
MDGDRISFDHSVSRRKALFGTAALGRHLRAGRPTGAGADHDRYPVVVQEIWRVHAHIADDAHNPAVKAAVAWYRPLAGDGKPLQPKNPIDIAKDLHGPVLGLYGGADAGISQESVDKMLTELKASGNAAAMKSQIDVYPATPHAFNADYRPSYRKEAAEDAWKKCLGWLKVNGVG